MNFLNKHWVDRLFAGSQIGCQNVKIIQLKLLLKSVKIITEKCNFQNYVLGYPVTYLG